MKRIKNQRSKIVNLLVVMWLMMSCVEVERGQYAIDNVPPGQVSNVEHENVPGGAIITYTIPTDEDLLYVKVVYRMSDGTQVEQKSSARTTKIVVEGLGRSQKQTVQLICGDLSGNESTPYELEIEPLDAPIYEILESVIITDDFGGIAVRWNNPLKAQVVLTIYVLDEYNRFVEVQNVYSASVTGKFNLRGYPAEERTFAVTVRDRWKNKTDMKSENCTPFFEEKLNRLKFGRWNPTGIPYDALSNQGWDIERLWDGLLSDPGFSTSTTAAFPVSATFNLGQTAYLVRIKVFQRTSSNQLFSGYNVKRFQLWASPHPNVNADFATWLFLGDFTSQKPSELPLGQVSDEDKAYAEAGEDYAVEENSDVAVQYIRLYIMENWGGGSTVGQFYEMEFYGKIVHE